MRSDWRTASIEGDEATLIRLLAEGADVDALDQYRQTALMVAAMHGQDAIVRDLLSHNADMNVTAKYNLSALMLAIINKRISIAEQLVIAGADVSIRGSGAPDFTDKTAFDLASERGLNDLAQLINRRA